MNFNYFKRICDQLFQVHLENIDNFLISFIANYIVQGVAVGSDEFRFKYISQIKEIL